MARHRRVQAAHICNSQINDLDLYLLNGIAVVNRILAVESRPMISIARGERHRMRDADSGLEPTEEIPDCRRVIKGGRRMSPVPRAPDHRLARSAALIFHARGRIRGHRVV